MSVFGVSLVRIYCIRTEYWEIRSISPDSVQMRENTDRENSEYGPFSRSGVFKTLCQTFKMELFVKKSDLQTIIFTKSFILDVWLGSKDACVEQLFVNVSWPNIYKILRNFYNYYICFFMLLLRLRLQQT